MLPPFKSLWTFIVLSYVKPFQLYVLLMIRDKIFNIMQRNCGEKMKFLPINYPIPCQYPYLLKWSIFCPIYFSGVQYFVSFTSVIFNVPSYLLHWCSLFCPIYINDTPYSPLIYFGDVKYSLPFTSVIFNITSYLLQWCSVFWPIYFSDAQHSGPFTSEEDIRESL